MKTKLVLTMLFTSILLTGCMPDSSTQWKEKPKVTEATSSGGDSSSTTSSVDVNSLTAFQLEDITEDDTTYHMHKYGAANAEVDCEIDNDDIADGETLLQDGVNDIVCWLEAEELQLYFNGAKLRTNIAPSMCEYIAVLPYYFWHWQPAQTIKYLKAQTCEDESSVGCATAGGAYTPTAEMLECEGDYSKLTDPGPNCDNGVVRTYNYKVLSGASVGTADPDTPYTELKCGGKFSNCMNGPAKDYKVDAKGYPIWLLTAAWDGSSVPLDITAPEKKGLKQNYYISNYTNLFATGTYTYDYTTVGSVSGLENFSIYEGGASFTYADLEAVSSTSVGFASKYIYAGAMTDTAIRYVAQDALKTSGGVEVNPFYIFACTNYDWEIKARIRLQIREWNQKFTSTTTAGDQVNRSNHSRLKRHSSNSTDYETSGIGYWNDRSDWDTPNDYGSVSAYIPASSASSAAGFLFPAHGL